MEKITRNKENFIIMTVIYNVLNDFKAIDKSPSRDINEIIYELTDIPLDKHSPFAQNLLTTVLTRYGEIVSAITPHLNEWKWSRLPLLTQAILLMSYARYHYMEKVDKRIIISVAIELAKKYIEEKQAKFINAILDEVL
ncbi:MAG: transcription antitermination protein NusB [Erysipelotrichia bacterium]|nr:transcription antitermination protein NusB [Erysipelotrichia bacterium]